MSIRGQSVVVTGAAQGIGECVARTLSDAGAKLLLADIQEEKVAGVAAELGCESIGVDVADPKSAESMIERAMTLTRRIDALINIAGIDAPYIDALDVTPEHWRKLIDVDLNGQWWCTAAALPHMVKQGSGRVVMISSIAALAGSPSISPAYSAAKSGLIGLVVGLSTNVEKYGVLVNAIAPGHIGTTGTPTPPEQEAQYLAAYPLGSGGPQPVADAVMYLLGDSGKWISGAVMNVSGGFIRAR